MAEKKDELLNHNYDGIQEYDNSLPGWWVALFYLCTIWGGIYVIYYHFGPGMSQIELLTAQMRDAEAKAVAQPKSGEVTEASLLALVADPAQIKKGAEVFLQKCASCHGQQGQGIVGPNLTDDHWIHGGTLVDIRRVVVDGVLSKGMLAWRGIIPDEEINSAVAYIRSIRGTNPPNAKAAEGALAPAS